MMSQCACRITNARTIFAAKAALNTQAGTGASTTKWLSNKVRIALGATTLLGAGTIYAMENRVNASEVELHPLKVPFSHYGPFHSLDYFSVRRGWQVYKQVCAACHTLDFICYRHFINVFMTEEECKAEAAEAQIEDTDAQGKPILRPGIVSDHLPAPYKNTKEAMAANGGSAPPDLTNITLARHGGKSSHWLGSWIKPFCNGGGEDYVFLLLTSYADPPAGVHVDEGKAYNPYFPNPGVIAMPQQLWDGGIEYADGTPATVSQQAKDVSTFLAWCAQPFHDTHKKLGIKILILCPPLLIYLLYMKKMTWTIIKSRKYAWKPVKGRMPPAEQ